MSGNARGFVWTLLGAVVAALALQPAAAAATLEIVDATGRRVVVDAPAARTVSLSPSVTEILFAIGAADSLVGVSRSCDFPVAAKLKPKVGDFNAPDLEKVAAARPDLVLFTEYIREQDAAALRGAGITAVVLPARTTGDVVAAVRLLGEITGRAAAAAELASRIEGGIDAVRKRFEHLPETARPLVYIEVDGPASPYAVGPASFMDELVRIAGGRNAFANRTEAYFPVNAAEVRDADPQVILIDHPFQYKVGLAKREGWGEVSAVREGRVYDGTDFDIVALNRPGPRILDALRQLVPLLHPAAVPAAGAAP